MEIVLLHMESSSCKRSKADALKKARVSSGGLIENMKHGWLLRMSPLYCDFFQPLKVMAFIFRTARRHRRAVNKV